MMGDCDPNNPEHHVITVVKTMGVVGKGMGLVIYGIIFIINAPCPLLMS